MFVKRTLEQRQCEIQDLSDKLAVLQKEQLDERATSFDKVTHLQKEYADMKQQLSAEITILGKLPTLEGLLVETENWLTQTQK